MQPEIESYGTRVVKKYSSNLLSRSIRVLEYSL